MTTTEQQISIARSWGEPSRKADRAKFAQFTPARPDRLPCDTDGNHLFVGALLPRCMWCDRPDNRELPAPEPRPVPADLSGKWW